MIFPKFIRAFERSFAKSFIKIALNVFFIEFCRCSHKDQCFIRILNNQSVANRFNLSACCDHFYLTCEFQRTCATASSCQDRRIARRIADRINAIVIPWIPVDLLPERTHIPCDVASCKLCPEGYLSFFVTAKLNCDHLIGITCNYASSVVHAFFVIRNAHF